MLLDSAEVMLEGVCGGLLLLPHEGSGVLALTDGSDDEFIDGEGRDKGGVGGGPTARRGRVEAGRGGGVREM